MLAVLPLMAPPAGAATPTITAVGTVASNDLSSYTGTTATLNVTPVNVGDVMVVAVRPFSPTITATGVAGGGATTWTKIEQHTDGTDGVDSELWMGPVTAAGASTITVTFTGNLTGIIVELAAQEFASGLGALTTWGTDGSGFLVPAASTNITFPSLTASGTAELYVGYAWVGGATTPGSCTAGTTCTLLPSTTDIFLYKGNTSGTLAPTATQTMGTGSLDFETVAGLITANAPAPTVSAVAPTNGPTTGGTSVTITGNNLTGATGVTFGGTAATGVVVNSITSVTAVAPAHAVGAIDVQVTTPGGTSATGAGDLFTYVTPSSPSVTSVSPSTGPPAGGTAVTVSGTNLTGATAVNFGNTAVTTGIVVNGGGTSLTVTSPAGTGTVDVTVIGPGGTSPTGTADHFTYTVGSGYWMVGKDGGVFAFGNAGFVGSLPGIGVHVSNIVGVVPTSTKKGYWMVGSDGGVFAFGDAGFVGSLPGIGVHVSNVVGVVPTATGKGYWMVGSDGGVFAFGDAGFVGSLPGLGVHVNDIVGVVPTATGKGYWMVGKDGGVFAFGDAGFVGSLPGINVHVSNIVGVVSTSTGKGYWMVGSDGGVFAFGDAGFVGSLPGIGVHVNNVVGVVGTPTAKGYWMVGSDGGVFAFGDAGFVGSLPGIGVHVNDIVGVVPT